MIPRYQRVLFWGLSGAIILMALFLLRGCAQAREKFSRAADQTPLAAPVAATTETVHLALADDATGTLTIEDRELPLPTEPTGRIRVLLARLLAEYSYKGSRHPLEGGPTVDDVFLLNLPLQPVDARSRGSQNPLVSAVADATAPSHSADGQLAVISLNGTFADHHPSGVEAESLTIASILATIQANSPDIQEVRFLVDGQPRETLNGHADLTRTYPVAEATPAITTEER